MPERDDLIRAISTVAAAWTDPDHSSRKQAVDATLAASDRFTEEAVAFAVNQQMALLAVDELHAWTPSGPMPIPLDVGVLNAGNLPFVELQDFLAVLLAGHRYLGVVSRKSPRLLPAFVDELRAVVPDLPVRFSDAERLFTEADALIATGSDETAEWVAEQCDQHDIHPERRLIRAHRFAVAVIDGRESSDDLEDLAEDALLHEGFGCRNVVVIWAPDDETPDRLLDAFAHFRGVFPAHSSTPGRLKMQQAFLEAVDAPHAYGEGLEFLLSKGDPEPQIPGHIRWAVYTDLQHVADWLTEHRDQLQLVVAVERLQEQLPQDFPFAVPGEAQRPPLDWCPDGLDTMDFLARLL